MRTSQVGATLLMVSLTPADAPTHLLPGHAGVGAGVVGPASNVLAVLVGVITLLPRYRGVTGKGQGQLPTLIAESISLPSVAALPGLEAAVLISVVGLELNISVTVVGRELFSFKSAVTVGILPDALIPTHDHILISVAAGVGVGGAVTRPHSSQHQQQCYYRDQDPHT